MKRKALLSLVLVFWLAVPLTAQQKFFFFEQRNPFKRQAKIPRAVLQVMRREVEGRRGCQITRSTNLASWFFGSRIYLAAERRAFILRSHQDCLNGADNDWFWIVLKTSRGYKLVLFDGTISVFVRNSKSHGLSDLETNLEAQPFEAPLKAVPCRAP